MKKQILLSSFIGLGLIPNAKADGVNRSTTRIYLDISDEMFIGKIQDIQYLKDANVLVPNGNIWKVNKGALRGSVDKKQFNLETLQNILGPHIPIEKVNALDIVLSTQDVKLAK